MPRSRGISARAFALALAFALLAFALHVSPASAQSTTPAGRATARPTAFPSPPPPATAQHTSYIVTTNKKGQIVTAKAEKQDRDAAFNLMTHGNVLQMFIRTAGGDAIPGRYRVSYDYAPETKSVRRSIALVSAGGVDPDALGAVDRMIADERQRAERAKKAPKPKAAATAAPKAAR